MDLTLPIDEIDAGTMNRAKFRRVYLSGKKPVILKGFAKLYPAGEKWTFDYFNRLMGDHIVGVMDNSRKKNTAYTRPDLMMKFSEFLDIIRRDEETSYRIFGFNMLREFPVLRKDFPTPEIVRGILGNLTLTFFGGKNTTVRFHYDIDCSGVLMTQVTGRKRVILISPEYDNLLYKVPFASFSLVDPDKPDYDRFPGLKFVKGYDFTLQPGDALYMPNRYWHFNTYLEGGMAISYRVLASRAGDLYNGFMNTTIRLLFDKSMDALVGEKWMKRKRAIAMRNADEAINRLEAKGKRQKAKI